MHFLLSDLDHINSTYIENTLQNISKIRNIIYKYNRILIKYELTGNIIMFSEFILNHLIGFTIEIYLNIIINVLIRIIDQSIKIYKYCVINETLQKYDFINVLILFVSGLKLFISHSKRKLTDEKKQRYIWLIRQYIKYIDHHYKNYNEFYKYIISYVTNLISKINNETCKNNTDLTAILDEMIHFLEIIKIYPKNLEDLIFNSTPLTILKRIQILLLNIFKNDVKSIDRYNYDSFNKKLNMIKEYKTLKDDIKTQLFNFFLYETFKDTVNDKIEQHIDNIIYQILESQPDNIFMDFFNLERQLNFKILNGIIYKLFDSKLVNNFESNEIKKLINVFIQYLFSSLIPERMNEIKLLFGGFINNNPNSIYSSDDKQYIDIIIDGFISFINMVLLINNITSKEKQIKFMREIIELYKRFV